MTDATMPVPTMPGASTVEEAWAKLPRYLDMIGGYDLWHVETLVRFDGSERAGARIIERITEKLAEHQIGHLPGRLPTDGNCPVLLYSKTNTDIGFLISLVHQLATQDVSDHTSPSVHQLNSLLKGHTALLRALRAKKD
ncbi:hypothetical protein ACFYZ0_18260 [Streptomyces sp. NPDC001708]|uniref:hypothetical protein n=1 Tax=Streptomyces sp. NPDC001708 TaxID=3364602 RepID=UPI00368AC7A9